MKIDNKTLSLLSLLLIPGLLSLPHLPVGSPYVLIFYALCAIGGLSLGTLIGRML